MAARRARVDPGPQAQVGLHLRPAQVDEAVLEPDHLVDLDPVVHGERRRLGRVQQGDRAVAQLDLAGGQVGVDGARRDAGGPSPSTATTYSLRTSTVPGTTHWTMPVWSRRSTKARCSPCSRRLATQPHTVTRSGPRRPPAASRTGRSAARWPRGRGGGLGGNGHVGSFRGAPVGGAGVMVPRRGAGGRLPRSRGRRAAAPSSRVAARTASTTSATGTVRWSPAPRRGRSDTVPEAASSGPTISTHRAPDLSAALNWAFIDRSSKARSADRPAARSGGGQVAGAPSRRRCRPRRRRAGRGRPAKTPSASQASRIRSMPMPKPMPGVGGPPSISTRPS